MAKLLAFVASLLLVTSSAMAKEDNIWSILAECSTAEKLATCLQIKLAATLEAASAARSLDFGFITLTRDPSLPSRSARSEKQLEESLPRNIKDKGKALEFLILDKAAALLQTHSLKFNFDQIAPKEEGRARRRRLFALLMFMFSVLPMKLGALALLAGKALIVSKIAIALALIIGLKSLISHHEDHEPSYQVVHGLKRDLNSHDLAYNAYTN